MAELAADWRVRLRSGDAAGAVLGAGVLVDARTVLTCAHVVTHPGVAIWAEFPENPAVPPVAARVLDDGWVDDRHADPSRDLAVLRLDSPRPEARPARLSTTIPAGLPVRATGYAERFDDGMTLTGSVAGLRGALVQIDARHRREVVRRGFSGAGAWTPSPDGEPVVVGLIVSWRGDLDEPLPEDNILAFSYLIPVTRIAELAAPVRELAAPDAWDPAFDRRTRAWLGDPGAAPVKISVVARGGGRARTLHHLEHLADLVHRPAEASRERLVERLLGRALTFAPGQWPATRAWLLGDGPRPAAPPEGHARVLLVDAVDEAHDPARLALLLGRLAESGLRLLLVFRGSEAPGWPETRDHVLEPALLTHADRLLARAEEKEARLTRETGVVEAGSLEHQPGPVDALALRRRSLTTLTDPGTRLAALRTLLDDLHTAYPGGPA
ncbi:serine protease [Streptomyces sp. NPDC050145]|uniref:serine protease n=1 Tax=Streptomyces sp. NPDC050145 TaxID=3365602 RepID=UPI0037A7C9B4